MRIRGWKRATTAVLAVWVCSSGLVGAALAAEIGDKRSGGTDETVVDHTVSMLAASASNCPQLIGCGSGCTATLEAGFCILGVNWEAKPEIAGFQLGPGIRVKCDICECWYIYTSTSGHETFKRTTKMSCSVGSPDIEVFLE